MRVQDLPTGGSKVDYLGFWLVWALLVVGTWLFLRRGRAGGGRGRLLAGNALVFASLFWTAVVAAESWLRFVYDETDQYGLTMTNTDWMVRHFARQLNERGWRDREWADEKPAGVVRVACVGDSFTNGWGVDEREDAWPQLVGAGLERASPGRFEVRNYGASGASTGNEIKLIAEDASKAAWDRVVLGYCLNDPDDLLPAASVFDGRLAPRDPLHPHSFLTDFLWFRLRLRDDPRVRDYFSWIKEAYEDPRIWAAQRERFAKVAAACRDRAVRLDVVVFPLFSYWGTEYPFDSCHDRVVEAWRALGVEAIDLRDAYRGMSGPELVVNRYDGHPNEKAHAVAARVVLERVFGVR